MPGIIAITKRDQGDDEDDLYGYGPDKRVVRIDARWFRYVSHDVKQWVLPVLRPARIRLYTNSYSVQHVLYSRIQCFHLF
jgi:hypothetical protein